MSRFKIIYEAIIDGINGLKTSFFSTRKDRFGYFASSSQIKSPTWGPKQNIYIYDNCGINSDSKFVCQKGKFLMLRNCSVGPGLTVITCNHKYDSLGQRPESVGWGELEANDVIVNEDVWIGANVTLCPGTIIGRGCIVAAGSVCVKNKIYPPYSIIGGNPAKFIKFRLTLDEQIQQEHLFYTEEERLDVEILKKNYSIFSKN